MSNYNSSIQESYSNAISMVSMQMDSIEMFYLDGSEDGRIDWDFQSLADGSEFVLQDLDGTFAYLLNILGHTVGMIELEDKLNKFKKDLDSAFTFPSN